MGLGTCGMCGATLPPHLKRGRPPETCSGCRVNGARGNPARKLRYDARHARATFTSDLGGPERRNLRPLPEAEPIGEPEFMTLDLKPGDSWEAFFDSEPRTTRSGP